MAGNSSNHCFPHKRTLHLGHRIYFQVDPGQICKSFFHWSQLQPTAQQRTLHFNDAALSTHGVAGGGAEPSSLLREHKISSEKQKLTLNNSLHWEWEKGNNIPGPPFPFCTLKTLEVCQHGVYYQLVGTLGAEGICK